MARAGYWQEAVELSRTAVDLAREAGDPIWLARTLATTAEVLTHDGHHEQAVGFAQAAAELARTLKDPGRRVTALTGVARALRRAGCRDQAEGVGREAVNAARTLKDPGQRVKALTSTVRKCWDILDGRVLLAEALDIGPLQEVVACLPDIAPETVELLARLMTPERPGADPGHTAKAGQRQDTGLDTTTRRR
ncbi:tetratricopeptide repeat protein [Streptomyces sp. NPDC021722]